MLVLDVGYHHRERYESFELKHVGSALEHFDSHLIHLLFEGPAAVCRVLEALSDALFGILHDLGIDLIVGPSLR